MTRGAPLLSGLLAAMCASCAAGDAGERTLVLGATTSTHDSGLLDALIPLFESARPAYNVRPVVVGTGAALALGRRGDVDVLLVHAPAAESAFVARGHGRLRCAVMHNDFVIVGPASDPAGVRGMTDAAAALRRIAAARTAFISRGDDSGTHRRELALWGAAGPPSSARYLAAGQGMGEVLIMAGEQRAYTLADRATHLVLRERTGLDVLVEGDVRLRNDYGVIPVTRARDPAAAVAFADWITSAGARRAIGGFGRERFGRALFTPATQACDLGR
ncbi:MAG: substrate-binding domain-containing protein [Longimicrobiales bacterium]